MKTTTTAQSSTETASLNQTNDPNLFLNPIINAMGEGSGAGIFDVELSFSDVTATDAYNEWQDQANAADYHLAGSLEFEFSKVIPAGTAWSFKRPDGTIAINSTKGTSDTTLSFQFLYPESTAGTYQLTISGSRSVVEGLSLVSGGGGLVIVANIDIITPSLGSITVPKASLKSLSK